MNLVLKRNKASLYGIFGTLLDENGVQVAVTIEHAYPRLSRQFDSDDNFFAKIPVGEYLCVRGQHRLHGMTNTFETFEITKVPEHTGCLFHSGNYNNDSDGCVILGELVATGCVLESRLAFAHFLTVQEGCDSFKLIVE